MRLCFKKKKKRKKFIIQSKKALLGKKVRKESKKKKKKLKHHKSKASQTCHLRYRNDKSKMPPNPLAVTMEECGDDGSYGHKKYRESIVDYSNPPKMHQIHIKIIRKRRS